MPGQIKIEKFKLKKILEENRKQHQKEFKEAKESYRLSVLDWYIQQTKNAKAKQDFEIYYNDLNAPEDHTEDYDTVLEELHYTEEEHIYLSQSEFRNYIQDKWNWQAVFKETAAYYNTKIEAAAAR